MKLFVFETIKKYRMISRGDKILCGVSGGADSVAMLRVLLELKDALGFTVCVAHLNHMLRGAEAKRDAGFVHDLCKEFGIEFFYQETDINDVAKKTGESIELAARNVRYAFFDRIIKESGCNKIATAHNAEDNLETVLMHLIRGSSLNGLGGIPPVRGNVIRPVIECTREQIKNYLRKIDQAYVEDSTNSERLYTRNRVRLDVLPILNELNTKASENVLKNSSMLREDEDYICTQAQSIVGAKIAEKDELAISITELNKMHPSLLRRVIICFARAAVKFTNYYLEFNHICDIINLTHSKSPSAKLSMPGGLVVARRYDDLVFSAERNFSEIETICLLPGTIVKTGGYQISCLCGFSTDYPKSGKYAFAIPYNEIDDIITIRDRNSGDSIKLPGRPEKTLKKLFIDMKIPKDERKNVPIIDLNGKVAAVYGIGVDERISASDKEKVMWVEIRRI